MELNRIWLQDFRSYEELDLELPSGLTAIVANNGIGKTNLVEACAYLATLGSFRGADNATMVQVGKDRAFVRGEVISRGRNLLIETEIARRGKSRVQVNRQRLVRAADLAAVVRVSVFTPEDLAIIKGSPGLRRDFVDDGVVSLWPRQFDNRRQLRDVLRQRNAFLRQIGGRLDNEKAVMLDIWDERLSICAESLGAARLALLAELEPLVKDAYFELAGGVDADVKLIYEPVWFEAGLSEVLAAGRDEDVRRGTTLNGPHRDDILVQLNGVTSRTHASQGEQRCLALALRLSLHRLLTERHKQAPLLILDDVFSELDTTRSAALFQALPEGQILLTSAIDLPEGIEPDLLLGAETGKVFPL